MSEAQTLEDLASRPRRAHAPTVRQAGDAEDLFESYLHDMRRFGRLTLAEELELAHHSVSHASGFASSKRQP